MLGLFYMIGSDKVAVPVERRMAKDTDLKGRSGGYENNTKFPG